MFFFLCSRGLICWCFFFKGVHCTESGAVNTLRLFPFRKRSLLFLTVDAIIANQAFSRAAVNTCSTLCYNDAIFNFLKSKSS